MRDRLDYLRRLLGTGVAFAVFFLGGALLTATAVPIIAAVTPTASRRPARVQRVIHLLFKLNVGMLRRFGVIDFQAEGAETLRDGAGRLVVANHPTLLDVVLLMTLIPQAQCIVKKDLWRSPFLGGVVRGAGYIPNDLDPEAMLEACRAALDQGRTLIIFPEGTRTRPGEPVRFLRGFANLATLLDVQIQLVTITCTPLTLTKGERWWAIPASRPLFRVAVGDRVEPAAWKGEKHRSVAARKLVREIEGRYAEQLGTC